VDCDREKQSNMAPSFSEAIRRLVELGLTVKTKAKLVSRPGRRLRAQELATKAIEKIIDPGAPPEERAQRRRRLVKGPLEFREDRVGLPKAEGQMTGRFAKAALFAVTTLALSGVPASAQSPKELKTKSGSSVVVVNFINPRPDCSANPGPIAVPVVREKPANGIIQMLIVVTDVAASGKCPARKIPSSALIYTPNKDFVGTDSVQIEVEAGNRTTLLSYRIVVQAGAEPL
jgi:hypothetical protein